MSNVMDVKDDGGWRSRASGILGFFACFVTLIPLLRSILGLKMPTGTRIPIELTYYKYGLLLGVGGTIAALAWGKGFGGWRLTDRIGRQLLDAQHVHRLVQQSVTEAH